MSEPNWKEMFFKLYNALEHTPDSDRPVDTYARIKAITKEVGLTLSQFGETIHAASFGCAIEPQ